jgi:hypothetical protein
MSIIAIIALILGSMMLLSAFFSTAIFFKNSSNKPLSSKDNKRLNFSGGLGFVSLVALLILLAVLIAI